MKNHKKTGFWYRAIARILAAGAVGTLIMSIPMYYGPIFHLPLWPVPHLLAAMLGTPVATGWLIHFAIGWIFTALYVFIRSRGMLRSRPWLLITCYIVFIYLVAVGSWFVFMCMHLITITDLSVLTYPYLLEHILFAVGMKWTLDILAPQPARSNYDLL